VTIGQGPCDYAGITPRGKSAIDAIVNAKRVDLLANILKGYNPRGRGYAAVALTAMQRKGVELPGDILPTLEVIRNLDLLLDTCHGWISSYKTAEALIA